MRHLLKINQNSLIRILTGDKPFTVRKNDRDYQVNDVIQFLPLEDENYDAYSYCDNTMPGFKIKYVHSGLGMQQNHVILSLEAIKEGK